MIEMHESFFQRSSEVSLIVESLFLFYWSLVCGLKSSCVFPRFQSCCSSLHASTCSYIIIVCERELLGRGEPNLTFVAIPLPLAHCVCVKNEFRSWLSCTEFFGIEGSFSTTITWTKKIGEAPQFVKIIPKNGYFSQKNCQVKGHLLDNQKMKKNLGRHHNLQKNHTRKCLFFAKWTL